jgi:hypothetical protein
MSPKKEDIIEPIDASLSRVVDAMMNVDEKKSQIAAIYSGELPIGDIELPCYVLEDGRRVLSQRGINTAFTGSRGGGTVSKDGAHNLPRFLATTDVLPFVSSDLMARINKPIEYVPSHGGRTAFGYEATLLPEICEVILDADKAGALKNKEYAMVADVLIRSFARVGIIALIDEATGYQRDRSHDALRLLLSKYIAEGLQKWLKTFPDSFFVELDKLYDNATTTSRNRPQYYGGFINKYVYNPIENGYVKSKLDALNITDDGKRKARFHQWLNDDGRNILIHQIGRVQGLMEMCEDIESFKRAADKQKKVSIAPYLFDEMNRIIE